MKRYYVVFLLMAALAIPALASEPISSFYFRNNMHEIFRNYKGIQIATREGNTPAAKAHVKLGREYVAKIGPMIPERDASGAIIDKDDFIKRLATLDKAMVDLDAALDKGAEKEISELRKTIFNTCVGCHRQAKLTYMFRLPEGQKLLGEYMHSIAENYELARIYIESGENEEAVQHMAIVNQLLSLLKRVFPDQGPSGVVMSRDRLISQISEVEGYNLMITEDIKQGKTENFDVVKKSLNLICISCHEPEKIK